MPTISESVTIHADIDAVFDLISRVEEFPLYVSVLKEVREIAHHTYRWVAQARGLNLDWDSVITEFHRPTRLTWRSIRGFNNSGTYHLMQIPEGTRVELTIEYSFDSGLLNGLMEALVIPLTRAATASILARVKERLEQDHLKISAKENRYRHRRFLHDFSKRRHQHRQAREA